jgi:hypothetical protein
MSNLVCCYLINNEIGRNMNSLPVFFRSLRNRPKYPDAHRPERISGEPGERYDTRLFSVDRPGPGVSSICQSATFFE